MNVYDFDKTIYDGDSTLDFYLYCLKKQPTIATYIPKQVMSMMQYKLKQKPKLQFKQDFYGFLKRVKNREQMVADFWEENAHKIKGWYKVQQKEDDLIISASPQFLLEPICKQLGIKHLIASQVAIETGECLGENCYGEAKVVFLNEKYPDAKIDQFYSDSLTDSPLAKLAKESFLVNKNTLSNWPK